MIAAAVIVVFWLVGSFLGAAWMKRIPFGFHRRGFAEVVSLIWGVIIAVSARWIIVGLSFGIAAMVFTYFAGCVICGPPRKDQPKQLPDVVHQMEMSYNSPYYKQQVISTVPLVVYVVLSILFYFVWK